MMVGMRGGMAFRNLTITPDGSFDLAEIFPGRYRFALPGKKLS